MEPKTQTTLQELKEGDRFYFTSDKKRVAHQVTRKLKVGVGYNATTLNGWKWPFDKICTSDRMVTFLRHTVND